MMKHLARPFVSRKRWSAGWPSFVATELAQNRRLVAAPRTDLRWSGANPSRNWGCRPEPSIAILERGIGISPGSGNLPSSNRELRSAPPAGVDRGEVVRYENSLEHQQEFAPASPFIAYIRHLGPTGDTGELFSPATNP